MATLRSVWNDIRSKHFRVAESTGSLGVIGIVAFLIAAVLLFKNFLGKYSIWVALAIFFLIPLLGL